MSEHTTYTFTKRLSKKAMKDLRAIMKAYGYTECTEYVECETTTIDFNTKKEQN